MDDVKFDRLRAIALDALSARRHEARRSARAIHVNAGEPFEIGGPARHAGLTGRKNGIDTYGEIARQSGSALSGKDPSRIERAGAYAARHAAKNIVAAGLAERCEVHLAYAAGQAEPISLSVETFGTGYLADEKIARRLAALLDFRPGSIVRRFGLRTAPANGRRSRLLSAARDLRTFRPRRSRPPVGSDRRRRGAQGLGLLAIPAVAIRRPDCRPAGSHTKAG